MALVVTLAVGAVAVLAYRPAERGFDSPAACLAAYRDAAADGDAATLRRCVADGAVGLEEAQRELRAVRHWNQYAAEGDGNSATIVVDQVRTEGTIHRVRYRLERSRPGWRIVAVGGAEVVRPPVRPGTHVNDVAEREDAP